jgi:spore photoproduct lyase
MNNISHLLIDQEILEHPETKRIQKALPGVDTRVLGGKEDLSQSPGEPKETLVLSQNRGRFLKPCPGTRGYLCCGYQILFLGANCPYQCSYCILQSYFSRQEPVFFVNWHQGLGELEAAMRKSPDRIFRVGTGEFMDSLALDPILGITKVLVESFPRGNGAVLELKTKSAMVDHLAGLNHGGRTILAWSLNPVEIIRREEGRTATLPERLRAAVSMADHGYFLAFHFDPIIPYGDWQKGYGEVIEAMRDLVPNDRVLWISLGVLRLPPGLKEIMIRRHPESPLPYEELFPAPDGKLRLLMPERIKLYRHLHRLLKKAFPQTVLYFCMEHPEVWQAVMGFVPRGWRALPRLLDQAVKRKVFRGQ